MNDKGLTTMNLKQINKAKVYQYIYQKKVTSKQQIVQELQMGLSTVSQNLTLLEHEGLIERNGYFASTGGRKAHAIRIAETFRLAVGIGILKNMFHITIVDLYGNTVFSDTIPLPYSNTPSYYEEVAGEIKKLLALNHYEDKILGISFATQGITSPDNTYVTYGTIMENTGMCLDDFAKYLPYPCHMEHDSKSAAALELWNHPDLDDALIFLLNRNLGGALITNHRIHQGNAMHGGTLEHMCMDSEGPLCYCGSRGCLETYCSANALEKASGTTIKEFFRILRKEPTPQFLKIWEDYLNHLAFAMKNLTMVIDAPVILSGYLAPYITEEDLAYLAQRIHASSPFEFQKEDILIGIHGQYTPAIGAALFYIQEFIRSI